jgi:hypothetical protein
VTLSPITRRPTHIPSLFGAFVKGPLWWARLGVAAGLCLLVAVWIARPWVWGDTPFVWDGTNAFIDCLSRGDFVACRHSGELDYWGLTSPIGDWPLLQHIPDLITIGLGADAHHTRELVFVFLSVTGVVGSVALARVVLSRTGQAAWFWGFVFIVLSGPLIVYGRTTAGEALATGLLVCLVAATVLRGPPPVVALAALAACLTKETSYPFVVALGVLGLLLAKSRTDSPIRRHLAWGGAGVAVGFVLGSLFNVVRFGSVLNTNYLEPELRTPGLGRALEYTLALLVSPNGGIAVYWPAATALVLTACLLPLAFRSGLHLDLRPALLLIAVIVALTLGFASWWDIFGAGYGPRLTLPWVLPIVLIALVAYGESLGDLALRTLASRWRLLLIFAAVLAFALPHVGHMWKPDATAAFAQDKKPPCDAPWRGGVEEFHACQHDLLWFNYRPRPLYSIEGVGTAGGALTSVVLAFALFCCLILLREGLRASRDSSETCRPSQRLP